MHRTATVAEWYRQHGKHAVYANPRKPVPLGSQGPPSLRIPDNGVLIPLDSLRRRPAPAIAARTDLRGADQVVVRGSS
jgi:hypothetical protein